jgi:hypothetical protein
MPWLVYVTAIATIARIAAAAAGSPRVRDVQTKKGKGRYARTERVLLADALSSGELPEEIPKASHVASTQQEIGRIE